MLVGVRHRAGVGEDGSLDVVERDPQKRSDADDFMEWRSADAAELPALNRASTDANDLPQLGARIARRLAALLQKSGKSCLLESHRRVIRGSTASQDTPLICGIRISASRRNGQGDEP
jgi:hypothetical protein